MIIDFNPDRSIQELERDNWGNPPQDATGLVQAVYTLRQRPLGSLSAYELGRLIGQSVGLRWTLPLALKVLRDTVDDNNRGGFYDDDLLSAVLSRKPDTWNNFPELAKETKEIVSLLINLTPDMERQVKRFHKASEGSA
ncbi:contact-dependent growth inhibition system immunity protein [Streptomyces sp. M-16]|uniref:contact-dependent growth inhibition system immunity protein n=1 Tax=Streptomyces sp. M-16 TaxID=3233040 RepID=UPI002250329B